MACLVGVVGRMLHYVAVVEGRPLPQERNTTGVQQLLCDTNILQIKVQMRLSPESGVLSDHVGVVGHVPHDGSVVVGGPLPQKHNSVGVRPLPQKRNAARVRPLSRDGNVRRVRHEVFSRIHRPAIP